MSVIDDYKVAYDEFEKALRAEYEARDRQERKVVDWGKIQLSYFDGNSEDARLKALSTDIGRDAADLYWVASQDVFRLTSERALAEYRLRFVLESMSYRKPADEQ